MAAMAWLVFCFYLSWQSGENTVLLSVGISDVLLRILRYIGLELDVFFHKLLRIISGCLSLNNNTPLLSILNFVSAFFCIIAALFQIKRCFALIEQGI